MLGTDYCIHGMNNLIDKLRKENILSKDELTFMIKNISDDELLYLQKNAREVSNNTFGNKVFIRGLIEFTNYCKNNCYYCGIRCQNANIKRYRLTKEQILECCEKGYKNGFRTFVLQGGEDPYFNDDRLCEIVISIKEQYTDCALTLSVGERSSDSYKMLYDAGVDRYLLRHETAVKKHYEKLHPKEMSFDNRRSCLKNLRETGFQTGSGFMVGSPYQTEEMLSSDLLYLKELYPHMIGIGVFIPHKDTPFADERNGSVRRTYVLLAMLRLMFPKVLLPATTAVMTLDEKGLENCVMSGANVVMPNLLSEDISGNYSLYNNKIHTNGESSKELKRLNARLNKIGYELSYSRGDSPMKSDYQI